VSGLFTFTKLICADVKVIPGSMKKKLRWLPRLPNTLLKKSKN